MTACTHLDQIEFLELPEPVVGCTECLATEPGEEWSWCDVDEVAFVVEAR